MIYILFAIVILAILIIFTIYFVYRFTFVISPSKRVDPHKFPDTVIYHDHSEKMLQTVLEMEKTLSEEVKISADDGTILSGTLYMLNENAPLIVFFHGYHGTYKWDGYGTFRVSKDCGYNVLMADMRAHGNSGSNTLTFGIKERFDCVLWVKYAAERFGLNTDIFLSGVSMGAASVLMAGELNLPSNVKGIISDCAYTTPEAEIKLTLKSIKLPVGPSYLAIKIGAMLFGRFDLSSASPLASVRNLSLPVLFIHGDADTFVSVNMCDELYENCCSEKAKVIIKGSQHSVNAVTDYETYKTALMNFVSENKTNNCCFDK